MTKISSNGRVNVEVAAEGLWGARIGVWFDGRVMVEASDLRGGRRRGGVEVWDDGVRVVAEGTQAWRLPEGARVVGFWASREETWLAPLETPQLVVYPHGRMARVWTEEDAVVMVFADSPKELMNGEIAPRTELGKHWLTDVFVAGRAGCLGVGTPAAQRAMAVLSGESVRWLRGEIGQFVMGARWEGAGVWIAGVTETPRVWTVRLEDVLEGEGMWRLTIWRDGLKVDGEACVGQEVEEIFEGLVRADKVALEMVRGGGFVAWLEPCHATAFRMVKGERE